ncbi:unnamed protein product [Clonostachys byssicola]|uniref:F-box domain-containing protein n=1 Tax=Clonostachys byssicola TaxID=160290 RepID=A0A9N9XZ16_9HYPO|nr:unnamed protein product [Clonostachys byssicola]
MDPFTAQGSGSVLLYKVPMEVLHRILSHLIKPWGSPENLNILLISKHMYDVALPLTVKIFENPLGLEYDDSEPEVQVARYQRRNARLLRYVLIKKPELAQHVQHIDMKALRVEELTPTSFGEHSEADLTFYANYLVHKLKLVIPYVSAAEWIDSLGKGCSDAHFAFMAASLTEVCTVAYDTASNDRDADAQRAREISETQAFARDFHTPLLPLFYVGFWNNGNSPRDLWHFRPDSVWHAMFARTELRSIVKNRIIGGTSMARRFERLPPRASPVEKISLSHSCISNDMLQALLNACRAVKEFTFESDGRIPGEDDITPEVCPRDFIQAMLPHAGTLKYLCATFVRHQDLDMDDIKAGKSFFGRQLAEMTALTKLVADMESVTGVSLRNLKNWSKVVNPPNGLPELDDIPSLAECLPASLEYLELRNCTLMVGDLMQEFVQNIGPGKQCEKLNHLRLLFNFYDLGDKDHLELWMSVSLPLKLDIAYILPAS